MVLANSIDPYQTARVVWLESTLFAILSASFGCITYSMVKPHCSNFRIITTIFRVSEFLGSLQQDFYNFYREYSLSGDYRSIVVRPTSVSWQTFRYDDVTVPLTLSDYDRLNKAAEPQSLEG